VDIRIFSQSLLKKDEEPTSPFVEVNQKSRPGRMYPTPFFSEEVKKMTDRLSKNFTLTELTKSQTATRLGFKNSPTPAHLENLKVLVERFLQPLRTDLDRPIRMTSCYRSLKLNKAIGGATKSQHSKGEAADFEVTGMDNYELAKYIRDNCEFDQLILEFYTPGDPNSGWVHCSYKSEGNRKQVLTATKVNGKTKYTTGLNT
jgi:uncharacterized protein YcbK (DUF882 family)